MIRLAEEKDIAACNAIYENLFDDEDKNGSVTNWVRGVYPTIETAKNAYEKGWLYVMEENGRIAASMILNHVQAQEYKSIPWIYAAEDDKVLVLHTLTVDVSARHRGVAKKMIAFYLDEARRRGCRCVRHDTAKENIPAQKMYDALGFHMAGTAEALHQGVLKRTLLYYEMNV